MSDADDKTVEYTYHANSQMKTLKAYLTSSTSETTEWILGITSPIVNPDMLLEMRYPDARSRCWRSRPLFRAHIAIS